MTAPPPSRPLVGIAWMIVTGLCFVAVISSVKLLEGRLPAAEAAFLRYALGLVFVLPMLTRWRAFRLSRADWTLFLWRGLAHTAGVTLWFYAMARITIADVTAMNYLAPIYVTIGAALFLGERLALRRILAVIVALIGALIILRPGMRALNDGHLAMVFAAIAFGASYLLAKRASLTNSPAMVVAMLSVTVAIGLAPLALLNWVPPRSEELWILMMVASFATAGHYTMTLAFRAAPVTVTQPVTFLQLVWSVAVGAVFFAEPIDPWVILGGCVIVAAISFISWREMVVRRRAITPNPSQTKG